MQNWPPCKALCSRTSISHDAQGTGGFKKQKAHTHIPQDRKCQPLKGRHIHHILPNSAFPSSWQRLWPEWKDNEFSFKDLCIGFWLLAASLNLWPATYAKSSLKTTCTESAVVQSWCESMSSPAVALVGPTGSSRELVHQLSLKSCTRNRATNHKVRRAYP